jgi:signal transduction histidine kinase
MLASVSIRIKLILSQVLLIAMVSVFIYSYYPRQQEQLAIRGIEAKIQSISNMFSIGVGIGMGETDLVAVSEALNWANSDSAVVYVSVNDAKQQNLGLLNDRKIDVPKQVDTLGVGKMAVVDDIIYFKSDIVYQNLPFGSLLVGYSLEPMRTEIAGLRTTTLYFCIALFTVGCLVSVFLSSRISNNIRKLDSAVQSIANGVENTRVRVTSNDEIGKLAKAFNGMLDKLELSRKNIINYSEQLKKQNEELNQFTYVVSHDLKAPLRAIFKLSEWIEEDMGDAMSGEVKQNMKVLRGRVFRLEALINGLLEYSKIGRINIASEKTNVNDLLKDVIDLLNPPSKFSINIQKGMPVINTKKILLRQVFHNLISNALKYNDKPEGVINISFIERPNFCQFTVEDNGIGISPAYHEKVFAIFQTLQARDKVEGTGIGLSIIKKIIDDMGGIIRLESQEGAGAKFTFTWPKTEAAPAPSTKNNISFKKIAI